ncbi:MAG: response regulator, partial [Caldimonas sp.]
MTTKQPAKPARILVMEDESDILEVLKLLLEYEGHHVVTARDGRAALAAAAAKSFDLVVMDISMPDM